VKLVSARAIVKALERKGFNLVRVKGSHHHYFKQGIGLVTVPVHGNHTLKPTTQRSIMRHAGLTDADL